MIIKKTRRLHLDELIDFVWNKGIKESKRYYSNNGSYVDFKNGVVVKTLNVNPIDLFTVEDDSNITLDTVLPYFLEKDMYYNYREHQNKSINDLKFLNTTVQIWLINEDKTHTLIWKYGNLSNDYGRFPNE